MIKQELDSNIVENWFEKSPSERYKINKKRISLFLEECDDEEIERIMSAEGLDYSDQHKDNERLIEITYDNYAIDDKMKEEDCNSLEYILNKKFTFLDDNCFSHREELKKSETDYGKVFHYRVDVFKITLKEEL